jgi:protein-disulfide isomerase
MRSIAEKIYCAAISKNLRVIILLTLISCFCCAATENGGQNASTIADQHSTQQEESFENKLAKMKIPESYRLPEIVTGKPNAPISLIIYFSPTCHHCRKLHSTILPEFKKKYIDTGKVKVFFRFYIDDDGAFEAAKITRCICKNKHVSKYLNAINKIFEHQEEWFRSLDPPGFLKKLFVPEEISHQEYDNCLKDTKIGAGLMKEQQRANKEYGISSVPAFVVGDKVHIGNMSCENLAKMCGVQ